MELAEGEERDCICDLSQSLLELRTHWDHNVELFHLDILHNISILTTNPN